MFRLRGNLRAVGTGFDHPRDGGAYRGERQHGIGARRLALYHPADSRRADHENISAARREAAALRSRAYRRHLDEQDGERVSFWPRPIPGLGAWGEELAAGSPTGILRELTPAEGARGLAAIRRYDAAILADLHERLASR
jgi:hypothetical protein